MTATLSTETTILATPTLNGAAIPVPATLGFRDVTFYRKSDFGGVVRVDARELTITTGVKFAQYDFAVKVEYKASGQRKARAFMLAYDPFFVVVTRGDAVEPDDMFNPATTCEATGVETKMSRCTSFDDRYVSDFEAKLSGVARLVSIVGRLPHPSDHLTVSL